MGFFSRSSHETAWSFALPRPDFVAGSYEGRTFLSPANHLGEDSAHRHHDSVHAIADGVVEEACAATGYGRVVVVGHRLPDGSHVCSIYGHLCGHAGYPLARDGARVRLGDVVGYIGNRHENGDGLEHLHLGLRKGRYDGEFCGYARWPHCTPKHYHPPTEFIRARGGAVRLSSRIEAFPLAPGSRELTFKAVVTNGFFYGGAFELRLRVLSGETERFASEAQTRKLAPGAAASLLFPTPLTDARTPPALLEVRPPGTESWRPVPAPADRG
ncbi:MAG TPA: M23 family metallopeptidase [Thermoanaerobaculia bacterium]